MVGAEMISLPYPISTNRYWRSMRGRMVRSKEATAYKKVAAMAARYAGHLKPLTGPVEINIAFHPKRTKKGAASSVRLDLDNAIKVALDSMNGIVFEDDKQVERLTAVLSDPIEGGGLSVWVSAI